jgi:hypothetical protein
MRPPAIPGPLVEGTDPAFGRFRAGVRSFRAGVRRIRSASTGTIVTATSRLASSEKAVEGGDPFPQLPFPLGHVGAVLILPGNEREPLGGGGIDVAEPRGGT